MAIIIDDDYKLLVQGITGHQGSFHTKAMLSYGTKVVAGVTPGKGGTVVEGVPVFDTVSDAVSETDANTSIIFVPAPFAKDAVFEAIDAGIKVIVIITERIPLQDAVQIMQYAKLQNVKIIGPNTPGIIIPKRKIKVGIMPSHIFKEGSVGVVSRSGTLTYEIVNSLSSANIGQSTCIGLGGDRIVGMSFADVLEMFEKDSETNAIVMIGEIGGAAEEEAAIYIKKMRKKVVAYIAGVSAPPEKRMGHAGAIISRGKGSAKSKLEVLSSAGVRIAKTPLELCILLGERR